MPAEQPLDFQAIIDQLRIFLQKRFSAKEIVLMEAFALRYYGACALDDLIKRPLSELFGAFISHWQLLYQRKPGELKIRIFNPVLLQDGWQSTHTIIEVSTDDIPFLVDSMRMEINRSGFQVHYAIHFGGLKVKRNEKNCIVEVLPVGDMNPDAYSEAPIYFEIDRQTDQDDMKKLKASLIRVLGDVKIAVADWHSIMMKVEETINELEINPPPFDSAEVNESKDFLHWLINNHFTFLGCRDYKLIGNGSNRALQVIPLSGLGVLRDDGKTVVSKNYADLPPQARKLALSKNVLIIAKTSTKSTVHRDTYTDYIGVKRFNEKGELIGERRFIGLYTSTAYHSSPRYIPFLRHKVAKVIQEFHYPPDSHNGKEVVHILETLPRDDLFQATHEELVTLTHGILHLQERKKIRLFIRKDSYGRYFSCLVYVPREIFNTELSMAMQDVLMHSLNGIESNFTTYFSDSVLARIHFLIRVNPRTPIEYNTTQIESILVDISRSWADELKTHLIKQFGEAEGLKYYAKYRKSFPASYTEYYMPSAAIEDIKQIENLQSENAIGMLFYQTGTTALRLKLFHRAQIALSDVMPMLENMGLRIIGERPHQVIFKDGQVVWISDFDMVHDKTNIGNVETLRENFQDAFVNIWLHHAEDDGFNRLVLEASLTWYEIAVLRAYTKYIWQIGFTFSQAYMEQTLVTHAAITRLLLELFTIRFTTEFTANNRPSVTKVVEKIENALEAVTSLDEDRIIRKMLEVILATVRTNFFQKTPENKQKTYISFKLNPAAISDLPLPRPQLEIFVYSPRVEGVHLRGGKVARGGLRWSDRKEDYRTEILGLMKAQQVKNSLIVPVGAKGGFFPKQLPIGGDRDAILAEAIYCYSTFIRGLLDVTDNIEDKQIIPPPNVVCYDEDDPYLVVAADKGTATFSDIANGISKEYRFWLGDAFASGGSAGYDHKKMGITARGAWESVKRHFRELNLNPDKNDFTVIGIGDMSGDVFGNGMLLSKHIKLLAAFNHEHIFVDPDPDPLLSFDERQRLFNLPRSLWSDYNSKLISKGGGIFSRLAKSIKMTQEIKNVFAIEADYLIPNEFIKAILKAPVTLIWNGGIGTFIKASYETHAEVGDRSNDAIRIDAPEVKAKVIGEGGNLGVTQLGRIEYSLNGGIVYTDFIDNSAGVDCSDHEVNIKILLNKLVIDKQMTLNKRNKLLEAMTNEVIELVLRDNYEQTQILSLEASVALQTMDLFTRYMQELEKSGRLNRKLEFLPNNKILLERKANGQGLTRPEIAILISYCKLYLKQSILLTNIPEVPYFTHYLLLAFPPLLQKKYLQAMKEHPLKREIIATQIAKQMTDHMGINFVERLHRETGAPIAFIIRAYFVALEIYGVSTLWPQIESLDAVVSIAVQQKMMLQIYYLLRRATRWFLRNRKENLNMEKTIKEFSPSITELIKLLPALLTETDALALKTETDYYISQGVPNALAKKIACCNILFSSLDIVQASAGNRLPMQDVAKMYYSLSTLMDLNWLREQMNAYSMENQWDELARSNFRDDLDYAQRELSVNILNYAKAHKLKNKTTNEKINALFTQNNSLIQRWQTFINEIKSGNYGGFVAYSVILRELIDLAQKK